MNFKLPFFPEQASAAASEVDNLTLFLVGMGTFFTVLIAAMIVFFAIRYRRSSDNQVGNNFENSALLEITWTLIPLLIALFSFGWGVKVFFRLYRPPANAIEYQVTGKQWMWKIQHPTGQREINELHVPIGQPTRLVMTSEDVIHSFFVPAFRVKADVVPGRQSSVWFTPTKAGRYHLFCTEFCGTEHSGMIGWVTVQTQEEYQAWLAAAPAPKAPSADGERLFAQYACNTCHKPDGGGARPDPAWHLRHRGRARRRRQGEGRRRLPSRVDPDALREDGAGLRTDHALLPGPGQRRGSAAADQLHQEPAGRGRRSGGNDSGLPGEYPMNAAATAPASPPPPSGTAERPNFLTAEHGLKSWLLTLDHKRVAILYLISVSCYFLLGGIFAMLMRIELMTPVGDLMLSDTYNRVFTGHGVTMVFFFLIPAIPGILGNFLIPLMIGAKDVAFPRLNLASWYLYMTGGMLMLVGTLNGGVDTGWTFYPPYSTSYTTTNVLIVGIGVFINGFSSILTGLNFMVTVHRMRCPGMTWFRLPLFIWGQYATSLIMVLGTPVVAITLLLLVFERLFHLGIFDPAKGGDPILFQHLFWFYSHPAVYIMILPSMAVISELIACFSRKRIFGYHFVAFASIGIAVLGFVVWGHHLYVSGQSVYAGAVFSLLTMLVAIPSAVKVFNWSMTLYQGSVSLETPMLYALGFIGLFTIGGLTGRLPRHPGLRRPCP